MLDRRVRILYKFMFYIYINTKYALRKANPGQLIGRLGVSSPKGVSL
jgi:hypothetical protein